MASQLQIANWALTLLGEKRLSALSDNNQNAELISDFWDMARDGLLRLAAWSFAIERISLPADSATPAWGYDYQYSLTDDVVRVLQVSEDYAGLDLSFFRGGDTNLYRIEQRKILTSIGAPLYVKWIVNSIDIGIWDASFARLMAHDLALLINPRATESESTSQRLAVWKAQAWAEAAATNAIEQPSEPIADDTWLSAHAS